jgi:tetratricopeptide (TPR) repeat protein
VVYEDIKSQNAGGNNKQLVEACRALGQLYENDMKIKEAVDVWRTVARLVPGDRDATTKERDLAAKTMTNTIEQAATTGVRGAAARSTQTDEQKKEAARRDIENLNEIKTAEDLAAAISYTKEDIAKRADDPRISISWAKLGDLYKMGNNYAEAKKAYESAREKDANNWSYKFKLDDLELWKMLVALKALEPKAKTDPAALAEYHQGRANMYDFKLASYLEREKQYSTDSKIKFELGGIFFDLAIIKKDKALYDDAIMRYQSTVKDPKFRIESGLKLAQSFSRKGQPELGLKRVDETLTAIPTELKDERWKTLSYTKGEILQQMNKLVEAKAIFMDIYEMDVKYRDVSKRIDDLSKAENGGA